MTVVLVLLRMTAACAPDTRPDDAGPADSTIVFDSAAPSMPDTPVGDSGAPKLVPVDEADSSFAAFRRDALRALQRRDTTFLYSILAPEIRNSFGGNDSIAGFKRIWKMEQPAQSAVWDVLTRVLTLGGKKQGESFVAPYVFAAWPEGMGAFEHVAITDANVPAHAEPDLNAPMVASLSHSILRLEEWRGLDERGNPRPGAFARVKLPDGRSVWVRASQAYSPTSWRAFFQKRDGRWIMNLFVAGD